MGSFLDRADARRVIYVGILTRSILTGAIAFAPNYGSFAVLVFLKGFANVCYWPAAAIVTNRILGSADRVKYYSGLSVFDQGAKIITPLVAGVLTMIFASQMIFIFSACMTIVGAILLPKLLSSASLDWSSPESKERGPKGNAMGFRQFFFLPRNLIVTIALGVGMSLALAVYDPHLARFLSGSGFDARAFSIVVSATGAGAVIGAILVRFVFSRAAPVALMQSGIAAFTIAVTGAAVVSTFYMDSATISVFVLIWLLNGLGYELFLIGNGVNLQNTCPLPMLGRISTSARSLQMLVVVSGPALGAWPINAQSRSAPFVVGAAIAWLLLGFSLCRLRANFSPGFTKTAQ